MQLGPKIYIKNHAKRYIVFSVIILVLFGSGTVFGEIFPVPNFTYLQTLNEKGRLDNDIRQYLRSILSVRVAGIHIDNNCLFSPLSMRISLNNSNCPPTGINIFVRTSAGRSLSRNADNHGRAAFRNLEIQDYPLTVSIPLTGFQARVESPVEQLVDTRDIITRLNNCPDNRPKVYDALFLRLLSITMDRPLFQKVNLITRYCRDISLERICDDIKNYLSEENITRNIRQRLTQDCPGVRNCLP